MIVIADATILIRLGTVGRLDILRALYGTVVVPQRVYDEVVVDGQGRPGALELAQAVNDGWIGRRAPAEGSTVDALMRRYPGLDRGEAEAIVVGLDLYAPPAKPLLLLDEDRAYVVVRERFARTLSTASLLHVLHEYVLSGAIDAEGTQDILRRSGYRPAPSVARDFRQHRDQRPAKPR
jgi:uncharacterized protein